MLSNPEGAVTFYAGAKFTAAELANYVGQTVESVSLFEYRPIYRATVVIFENGKAVAEQPVDMSNFKRTHGVKPRCSILTPSRQAST